MIKIYRAGIAQLPDEEAVERNMIFLDETRKRKVNQCRNLGDKRRSLLAGYLIQAGAKDWMWEESGLQKESAPLSLSYAFSEYGKPYLRGERDLYFNLSHSGNYVVCAFSDKEIGIDIQMQRKKHGDIVRRFFSNEDKELLEKMTKCGMGSDEAFYCMWTVKESYMKLTGEGMRQGLDTSVIEISHDKMEEASLAERKAGILGWGRISKREETDSGAYFRSYEENDQENKYSISVCSYGKMDDIQRKEIHI
ncbi:MAG: 4'-phosphopantetheinyl transferase superfamily protein [Kineothrix sp.]|nr:4'-phosphopantetheinyl transferase superfamily protein [Kineothrix sp.]NBI92596.1 4'-phosphopantetheinyl transferase superfamily protein [Lachnospiraceae bacterium]